MRLTCPNCGAEYEVPHGMVPAAGRHVQCTACHTRWFVRGEARAAASEEQILTRLETWRPRPVAVPAPVPAATPVLAPVPDAEPDADESEAVEAAETEAVEIAAVETETTETETTEAEAAPAEPDTPPPAPKRADPAKPGDRPSVGQPAPLAETAPPPVRPAPRLDLGTDRAKAPPETPAPSRFGRGVLVAVVLALLALGAYLYRAPIAERVPATGPALEAYGDVVDEARAEVARRYGDLRERTGI
jgi:predicted Zn finger-like uncharacterized protein